MSEIEYPEDEYPTNCYGTFYLLSSNVRDRLYQVIIVEDHCQGIIFTLALQAFIDRGRRIFKIDDVFTTGNVMIVMVLITVTRMIVMGKRIMIMVRLMMMTITRGGGVDLQCPHPRHPC